MFFQSVSEPNFVASRGDLCKYRVGFRVRKRDDIEITEHCEVVCTEEAAAWELARHKFRVYGFHVGVPADIKLIGRYIT
jgi:hypothetical protein